jgi:hypothetical protein
MIGIANRLALIVPAVLAPPIRAWLSHSHHRPLRLSQSHHRSLRHRRLRRPPGTAPGHNVSVGICAPLRILHICFGI